MLAPGHQFVQFAALMPHKCSQGHQSTQRLVFIIQMIHALPQWKCAFIVSADQVDRQ